MLEVPWLGLNPTSFWEWLSMAFDFTPLGSWFHPLSHPSFSMKRYPCLQLCNLSVCFLLVEFGGPRTPFHFVLSLSHLVHAGSVLANTIHLKILWVSCESNWGTTPLDKSHTHKSLQDKLFSTLESDSGETAEAQHSKASLKPYCLSEWVSESLL